MASWNQESGPRVSFRVPPTPFREPAYTKGPGHCCVCGQPIFRFGWHRDLWGDGRPNQNATWHSCCVAAWNLWIALSDHVRHLKVLQKRRCLATGERLIKNAEVDHRVPLFKAWHDYRDTPWPALLTFWGVPNLQVINRSAHVEKCAQEAGERRVRAIPTIGRFHKDSPKVLCVECNQMISAFAPDRPDEHLSNYVRGTGC